MFKIFNRIFLKNMSPFTIALMGIGSVLILGSLVFFLMTAIYTNNLDKLNVLSSEVSTSLTAHNLSPSSAEGQLKTTLKIVYPGAGISFRQWSDPRGTINLDQDELLQGFTSVNSLGLPFFTGDTSKAVRMLIPALDIDVPVKDLAIINLGDSLEYETPAHTVGHIPGTANPGSQGNGWYFGHLESPIKGEGNVFARLPKIPALLLNGEEVFVIIESRTDKYLYSIVETKVLPAEELEFFETSDARITLVTCQPRGAYDHRLLVTGTLIGFRKLLDPI